MFELSGVMSQGSGFLPTLFEAAKHRLLKTVGGTGFNIYVPRRASGKGLADAQGDPVQMLAAFKSIVFACIHVRAREVANSAAFLAQTRWANNDYQDLPIKHPLAALMANPNQYLTAFTYWYLTVSFLDLVGNMYSWIARDKMGVPRALWPVPPTRIRLVPGDPKKSEPIVKGYWVKWSGEVETYIPEEDMLHLRHPNPTDIYGFGGSLVIRAAYEIDIHDYALKYQRDFFENFGMPSWLVMYPDGLNPGVKKDLKAQWEEKKKVGSMMLLDEAKDVKVEKVEVGDGVAQLESLGINVATIRAVFGVPKSKLMDTETIEARATAEAMNYTFHSETIDPLLTMIEQQITTDIALPFFGENIVVRHRSTIPRDPKTQAELDNIRLDGGVTFINEIRQRDGLEPVEGGDEPLVSFSLERLSNLGVPPALDPESDPDKPDDQKRLAARKSVEVRDMTEDQKAATWRQHERYRAKWELRIARKLRPYFQNIRDEVLAKINESKLTISGESKGPDDLAPAAGYRFDVGAWVTQIEQLVGRQAALLVEDAFKQFLDRYSIDGVVYAPNSPAVRGGLDALSARTVTIPETLHGELQDVLNAGIEARESVDQLANRVSRFFDNSMDYRSIRIARTISNYGVNLGNRTAASDTGFTKKVWLSQRDDRVRDTHAALDGEEIGINEKFRLANGDALDVPGDPAAAQVASIVNCRCVAVMGKGK